MTQRWEYEISRGRLTRDQLNALGALGWELVTVTGLTWLFKRPVEEGAAETPADRQRRDRAELQQIRGH